jgi:tetratricopeptide (TPR) repeat protein
MEDDFLTMVHKLGHLESRDNDGQIALSRWTVLVLLVAVAALVLIVHVPVLQATALSFDDSQYLTDNALVQNPSLVSVGRFLTEVLAPSTVRGYYQPLSMISLMLDRILAGESGSLLPFHMTSLVLHIANTMLVVVLLYLLFGKILIAAAVGILFGLHPMWVESISWVSERKTLLAAFFSFISLVFYVRSVKHKSSRLYVGAFATYVLALGSKPTSLPLPIMLLLMDYWPLRRLRWRTVAQKIPFFVVGLISGIVTYVSQSRTSLAILPHEYPTWHIPLVMSHNIIFYLYKILWPVDLSFYYPCPETFNLFQPLMIASVVGTCILVLLLVVSWYWTRAWITSWLIFLAAVLPTMGVVRFTNVIAANRYAYLPSIGVSILLAWLLVRLTTFRTVRRRTTYCGLLLIAFLTATVGEVLLTRQYATYWSDTVSLYTYMVKKAPAAAILRYNLANVLKLRGRMDEAISQYSKVLETRSPYGAMAHNNLGTALRSRGRLDEAVTHYRKALEIDPDLVEARFNLANVLHVQGQREESIAEFERTLAIDPSFAEAYVNLGNVFSSEGRFPEACRCYDQALKVNPRLFLARCNLALALMARGLLKDAVGHWQEACRLHPDSPLPWRGLAWILATSPDAAARDADKAIEYAQRAAVLTQHHDAGVLDTLAAAYAAKGQFEQAAVLAKEAVSLAVLSKNEELAAQARLRLELYEHGQAYEENIAERRTPSDSQTRGIDGAQKDPANIWNCLFQDVGVAETDPKVPWMTQGCQVESRRTELGAAFGRNQKCLLKKQDVAPLQCSALALRSSHVHNAGPMRPDDLGVNL